MDRKISYVLLVTSSMALSCSNNSIGLPQEITKPVLAFADDSKLSSCGEFSPPGKIKLESFTADLKKGRLCSIPIIEIYPTSDGEMPTNIHIVVTSSVGSYSFDEPIEPGSTFFQSKHTAPCSPNDEAVLITASATNDEAYSAVDAVVFKEERFGEVAGKLDDGSKTIDVYSDANFVFLTEDRSHE